MKPSRNGINVFFFYMLNLFPVLHIGPNRSLQQNVISKFFLNLKKDIRNNLGIILISLWVYNRFFSHSRNHGRAMHKKYTIIKYHDRLNESELCFKANFDQYKSQNFVWYDVILAVFKINHIKDYFLPKAQ